MIAIRIKFDFRRKIAETNHMSKIEHCLARSESRTRIALDQFLELQCLANSTRSDVAVAAVVVDDIFLTNERVSDGEIALFLSSLSRRVSGKMGMRGKTGNYSGENGKERRRLTENETEKTNGERERENDDAGGGGGAVAISGGNQILGKKSGTRVKFSCHVTLSKVFVYIWASPLIIIILKWDSPVNCVMPKTELNWTKSKPFLSILILAKSKPFRSFG